MFFRQAADFGYQEGGGVIVFTEQAGDGFTEIGGHFADVVDAGERVVSDVVVQAGDRDAECFGELAHGRWLWGRRVGGFRRLQSVEDQAAVTEHELVSAFVVVVAPVGAVIVCIGVVVRVPVGLAVAFRAAVVPCLAFASFLPGIGVCVATGAVVVVVR